jgi:hypothetical protein
MTELVKVEPKPRVIKGEIMPPESKRMRYYQSPTAFARDVYMMPEFEAESRGHQVHPIQCSHHRRCYYYREWTCADCGVKL